MMFHSASPVEHEEGCPITTSVARPCPNPGSPPHDTMADDGEEVALLFPYVIDDLGEAARQRHARHFLASALSHGVEPCAQRPGPTRRLGSGENEDPAEQRAAFLTDVARPDPIGARPDARSQPDVARDLLGVRKAVNVTKLENEHDGDEGPDAGDRTQPLYAPIATPPLCDLDVELTNVGVQKAEQRNSVLPDPVRNLRQGQALELLGPARREPALARGRLEIAAGA
jgi:hypothetical protein